MSAYYSYGIVWPVPAPRFRSTLIDIWGGIHDVQKESMPQWLVLR